MNRRRLPSRIACLIAIGLIASEAMLASVPIAQAASPDPSPQVAPSSSPAPTPDATPTPPSPSPAPSDAPSPSPSASPAPTVAPEATPPAVPPTNSTDRGPRPGATELVAERTDRSQTYDNHDGTKTTEFYLEPVFYKPQGSNTYQPIELGFGATAADGLEAISDQSPITIGLAESTSADDFLRLSSGSQQIGFAMPDDLARGATAVKPTTDGHVADYTDFYPGVDLRVIANADGAKSFFVWHGVPGDPSLRYVVDAPGLTLVPQPDGSISLVDAKGVAVAMIPRPYAVDSTQNDLAGGGRYTDKVSLSVAKDGKTITVAVDPEWLKTAVYPVYVDPSTGWVYNTGSTTYGDTFSASNYPNDTFENYQRPDSPYYHELWNGLDPSGTSGTSYTFLRWDLSAIAATAIDSASLALVPYHQYYNAPTVLNTYVRRVTGSWAENTLTYNNQPNYTTTNTATGACVEALWCYWDVAPIVQLWANGISPGSNYGFQIDNVGHGSTYWKRFISAEETGLSTRPKLTVTYHTITATPASPAFTGTIGWTYANGDSLPQTKFRVEFATTSAFTTVFATSGDVSSAATSWRIGAGLTDDVQYWYRVAVYDGVAWSAYSTPTAFTYDAFLRGSESYYESVPFDLGGGLGLDIGTQNGEARLHRDLFSIPSYGPAGELSLTHSSLDPSGAGAFGTGWSSNLTQYLTFENSLVVWHRPDGGRVAFANVAGTWTVQGGHFETLVRGTNDVITLKDQTKLTFQNTSAGHLLSIANRFGKALTITGWGTSTVTATDAAGRAATLGFTGALISTVTDSAGRAWAFTYTGTNLTKLKDPALKDTDLVYSGSKVTTITRSRTKAAGGTDTIVWAIGYTGGLVTSVIDPIGAATAGTPAHTFTTTASSTVAGLLRTYPAPVIHNTTTYTLDTLGRSTSILDPGGYTTKQTFDAVGDLTRIDRPVDLSPATWARTDYLYTAGNPTQEVVGLDATTTGAPTDTVTNVMTYNATNDLLTSSRDDGSSAIRVITLNKYDGSGHLTDVIENCTTTGTTPPVPASGCTGNGTHDGSTNLTTTYTYTANDQVDVEWNPRGFPTKHVYDANGNETSTIVNCTTTGTTIPTRGTSCTGAGTHDATTNVTTSATFALATRDGKAGLAGTTTDALGAVTTNTYDVIGRLTDAVLPSDASIPALTRSTAYDEFDDPLTTTELWPGLSPSRVTTSVYDLRGRLLTETDPAGGVTSSAYDAAGDVTSTTVNGVSTVNSPDGLGNVTQDIVGGLVTTTHAFNALGVEVLRQPSGTQMAVIADAVTRPTRITVGPGAGLLIDKQAFDHVGHTKTYRVIAGADVQQTDALADRLGRQVSVASGPTGALVQTSAFDANGNETGTTMPASAGSGPLTTTTYDALDRPKDVIANDVAIVTDPTSQDLTTTSYYDAAGQVVATKDPTNVVTRTFYNVRGLPSKIIANCTDSGTTIPTDPATCAGAGTASSSYNVVTTMTYDGSGAQLSVTSAPTSIAVITASTYDAAGRLTKTVVDPSGLALTTEYAFDANGQQAAIKDPAGTITRTFYDAAGRVSKTVVNCTNTGTTMPSSWATCAGTGTLDGTWNLTSTSTYDARGNKATDTAPNGRVTSYTYDAADRLISRTDNYVVTTPTADQNLTTYFYFDDAGNQAAVKAPTVDRATFAVTRTMFDAFGRATQEIRACTDSGVAQPTNPATCSGAGTRDFQTNISTTYAYDDRGNRIRMTVPDPSETSSTPATPAFVTTQYAFDATDRLCRVVENATLTTNLQTLADPCSTATQTAGTTTTNLSTRYTFDASGQMHTMVDAAGNTTTYGYDGAGRMTSLTDALGKTLVWKYDELGNRIRQENRADSPMTPSVTWTYDKAGRMLTRVADSITTTYTYDNNGNRLTASDGTLTITSAFDRLNRVLNVDDEDAGTTADTTYTYSLTSPTWTDPTGTYAVTLDKFDRATAIDDPVNASNFVTTYRADGLPTTVVAPNGITTTSGYDTAGHLTSKTSWVSGPVNRAAYTWTYNRAAQVLSEASTITGDTSNGTLLYGYDQLGQLTSAGPSGSAATYQWDKVSNRTSAQPFGGSAVATTYDVANRPATGTNPTLTYGNDFDGRLTARTGQTLVWDHLGRLKQVKDAAGTTTIATYTYDPLDRLRTVDYGGSNRIRFRYVGQTTSAAQWIDDVAGTVTRSIGTGWSGERLLDWTGAGSNIRIYGENAHHDVTWLADSTGAVSQTLRYDPWGNPRATVPTGYTPFRFQGSWYDVTTDLSWVVTRWYAPLQGRFVSEDSLLGEAIDPPSRQLYAYGQGEPVGTWDPDGRMWYRWRAGDTLRSVAATWLGSYAYRQAIYNLNRNRLNPNETPVFVTGKCVWLPTDLWKSGRTITSQCAPKSWSKTGDIFDKNLSGAEKDWADRTRIAATRMLGSAKYWFLLSGTSLASKTTLWTHRGYTPTLQNGINEAVGNALAATAGANFLLLKRYWFAPARLTLVYGHPLIPPRGNDAATLGHFVFLDSDRSVAWITCCGAPLLAHEYIHTLQWQGLGSTFATDYAGSWLQTTDATNPLEAPAYLWGGWIHYFRNYGELLPWQIFKPL